VVTTTTRMKGRKSRSRRRIEMSRIWIDLRTTSA